MRVRAGNGLLVRGEKKVRSDGARRRKKWSGDQRKGESKRDRGEKESDIGSKGRGKERKTERAKEKELESERGRAGQRKGDNPSSYRC